jgi:membrane protein
MKKKKYIKCIFLLKTLLVALPVIVLITFYVVKDPFMILREYDDYDHPECVLTNVGYISWLKFKKNNPSKHYDSFILGASCTAMYQSVYWRKHIEGSVIRLTANNNSLYELAEILEALEKQPNQKINNVLIVSDPTLLADDKEGKGFSHIFPTEVSGKSVLSSHLICLKGLFKFPFLTACIKYYCFGKMDETVKPFFNDKKLFADHYTNDDVIMREREAEIRSKGLGAFYKERQDVFAGVDTMRRETMPALFGDSQIALFKRVKAVAQRHNTNLKIAIGPNLETGYMNPKDDAILREIFGDKNVVNYNVPARKDLEKKENFYDKVHYRPHIAKQILRDLYAN